MASLRIFIPFLAVALLLSSGLAEGEKFPGRRADGAALLGKPAQPLKLESWINSDPLEIETLRGKVVLVRWFTDTCPFCSTTAPALVELHEKHGPRGLQVLGIFHPKPPGDGSVDRMSRVTRRFGFTFPVASDPDWTALRRWWLDAEPRGWTSVTFLVDREGIIRHVHPGGEFHRGEGGGHWDDHSSCRAEYEEIDALIERLLSES